MPYTFIFDLRRLPREFFEELMLGYQVTKQFGISAQGLPLLKNGCANTWFDVKALEKIL
ncbi:MAG: hypothetical protein J7J28_04285 [Thaumarchaeota archaeon]|nr:hypothetical protein [Nitrososphaerota archaeon]